MAKTKRKVTLDVKCDAVALLESRSLPQMQIAAEFGIQFFYAEAAAHGTDEWLHRRGQQDYQELPRKTGDFIPLTKQPRSLVGDVSWTGRAWSAPFQKRPRWF